MSRLEARILTQKAELILDENLIHDRDQIDTRRLSKAEKKKKKKKSQLSSYCSGHLSSRRLDSGWRSTPGPGGVNGFVPMHLIQSISG